MSENQINNTDIPVTSDDELLALLCAGCSLIMDKNLQWGLFLPKTQRTLQVPKEYIRRLLEIR